MDSVASLSNSKSDSEKQQKLSADREALRSYGAAASFNYSSVQTERKFRSSVEEHSIPMEDFHGNSMENVLGRDRSVGDGMSQTLLNAEHSGPFSNVEALSIDFLGYPARDPHANSPFCAHPKVKQNLRAFVAAVVMTVVGCGMFGGAILLLFWHIESSAVMLLAIGGIFFIPGTYYLVYICCAAKGKKGWTWNEVPEFG